MREYLTEDKKILIVGLGLIGASYAEGLRKAGYNVGGIDLNQATVDYALKKGIITSGASVVEKDYVSSFDIVVFALYPKVFEKWIADYQSYLRPGVIITDVTGVKVNLLNRLKPILRPDIFFVPAHPMAGKEKSGIEASDCSIFKSANFIITPIMNAPYPQETIREMASVLGFRKISVLSPSEHDEMIGFLSQLTHCIAVALMDCKESAHLVDYTGDSFRDLTRIAAINENMWTELFLENRDELLSQMELFIEKICQIKEALAACDADKLKAMMRLSTERRKYFD